jgi:hypothetical protein
VFLLQEIFREFTSPPRDSSPNISACYGLQGWDLTHALTSFNILGNTLDLNNKWARTFALDILQDIFIEPTPILI